MVASKLSVGNTEILVLHDNETSLPLSMTFPDVSPQEWLPYQEQYPEGFNGVDNLKAHFECYLIRSEGRTILVDTGLGGNETNAGSVEAFAGGVGGRLLEEMQGAGVTREDIDTVFFSHLHPDHVGWNLVKNDHGVAVPTFPRARYMAHEADWEVMRKPEVQEAFPAPFWDETLGPLETLGVAESISGEHFLTREITAIPTPGHTPGSMGLVIKSEGQIALILGDVFHNPAQIAETDWVFSFDMDPTVAIQTRKRMIDRAEHENALVGICHHSGFGRILRAEGKRYWQAI